METLSHLQNKRGESGSKYRPKGAPLAMAGPLKRFRSRSSSAGGGGSAGRRQQREEQQEVYDNLALEGDEVDEPPAKVDKAEAAIVGRESDRKDGERQSKRDNCILSDPSDTGLGSLLRKVKAQQAAILDTYGEVQHVTSGWSLPADDCRTLGRLLSTPPTSGLWRVTLFGEDFQCLHCHPEGTVVGNSTNKVMAAGLTRNHIVLCVSSSEQGSCLQEVRNLCRAVDSRGL